MMDGTRVDERTITQPEDTTDLELGGVGNFSYLFGEQLN